MNKTSAERAMVDCQVPGGVVEVQGRLIRITVLNEAEEKVEVRDLGLSEFADMVLDWCDRLRRRGLRLRSSPKVDQPSPRTAGVRIEHTKQTTL
jgi:hypothetical protein